MHKTFSAFLVGSLILLTGCEDALFDYYPHHEKSVMQADVTKSGAGHYGGINSNTPVVIAGSGAATNPSATSPTTSTGLP